MQIRHEYENRILSRDELGIKHGCGGSAIESAIIRAGGKLRPKGTVQKYFRRPVREHHLFSYYRLIASDMDFLWQLQKGRCLWCQSPLPREPIDCQVDHINAHGYKVINGTKKAYGKELGHGLRRNVRGLCCPGNICNLYAGRIERKPQQRDWGLLTSFVRHIRAVLKRNNGHIKFPNGGK